jgi:hypothetical protein
LNVAGALKDMRDVRAVALAPSPKFQLNVRLSPSGSVPPCAARGKARHAATPVPVGGTRDAAARLGA